MTNSCNTKHSSTWFYLTLVIALSIFTFYVWQSLSFPISHDEGYTFNNYAKNWRAIFDPDAYIANNHVLYSLLCAFSVKLFGDSLIVLRLPALFGAALFLVYLYKISKILFGTSLYKIFVVLIIGLNPLVLNYFSSARGYGLAMGLSFYGLYYCLRYLIESDVDITKQRVFLIHAAIGFSLSVASSLTFVIPNSAIVLTFFIINVALCYANNSNKRCLRTFLKNFAFFLCLPGLIIAFSLLYHVVFPQFSKSFNHFYFGSQTLSASITSVFFAAVPKNLTSLLKSFGDMASVSKYCLVIFLFIISIPGTAILKKLREGKELGSHDSLYVFFILFLITNIIFLILLNQVFGVLYPKERTGISYVIYFTLICLFALWKISLSKPRLETIFIVVLLFFGTLHVCNANQPMLGKYRGYNHGIDKIFTIIKEENSKGETKSIAVHGKQFPAAKYYKTYYGMDWLNIVLVYPFSMLKKTNKQYSYYLLLSNSRNYIDDLDLTLRYLDDSSWISLAEGATQD